jgi:hypothetical protein
MIEYVQKRATKQIPGIKNLSYEERLFPMFIQSVFERINRWCIHNIFWQFIPVFCYSNAEGVYSDVSVCSIIYHFPAIGSCTKSLLCVIH